MNNISSLLLTKMAFFLFVAAMVAAFFSTALSAAILCFIFLFSLTLAVILKFKIGRKELLVLILIGFVVHGALMSLIYFSGFRPVGGGADYETYNSMAKEIAQRASVGNFSLRGVRGGHDFTLLAGAVYSLFYPDILVGNVLVIWFFCLSLIFSYLIATELGASPKVAFLTGILVSFYPSYLYFGSLLLKDTIVIPLTLFAMLVSIKMFKEFSWVKFLIFFIILTAIIHLRFYIGYAIMFSFMASWFFLSNFNFKKRLSYGLGILLFLGFAPYLLGNGYYGMGVLKEFISARQITIYREISYNPDSPNNENVNPISPGQPIPGLDGQAEIPPVSNPSPRPIPSGFGSSFVVETGLKHGALSFIKNSFISFAYGLLGPFPWQLRYKRQYIALFETIPWYAILIVFGYSFFQRKKEKSISRLIQEKRLSALLVIFGILAMAGLSLFINNYGILMRIRIPIIICLVIAGCVVANDYLENYLRKIPWVKNI